MTHPAMDPDASGGMWWVCTEEGCEEAAALWASKEGKRRCKKHGGSDHVVTIQAAPDYRRALLDIAGMPISGLTLHEYRARVLARIGETDLG